jgi:tetratricopeptide (TPR) repeat protein
MNDNLIAEHNRLFKEASTIIHDQIPLHGQPELPSPNWLLAQKLRHAVALYKRVLDMNPANWSAMWLIGKVHQRFRELPEALTWFERSHQTNPSQPDVVREASICAMEIGSTEKAIEYSLCAAQLKPSDAGLRANLALAYLLAGRITEAQKSINEALAAEPADKISQAIEPMIAHFVANGRVPPTTTQALLKYWERERRARLTPQTGQIGGLV